MERLSDRVAWISGGASGIGLALAHRLAREHVKLVLVDIEQSALDAAARSLRDEGATVLTLRCDVSKSEEVAAAAKEALAKFGLVHIIVNNAGVGGGGGPMWSVSEADWQWTLGVNLWGVIYGIRNHYCVFKNLDRFDPLAYSSAQKARMASRRDPTGHAPNHR